MMFWKSKGKIQKMANVLIKLAWETDIGSKEESVVTENGLELAHYSGVVTALNIFAVEYGFILESYKTDLSDDDVKEIGRLFWEDVMEKCKSTPNPAGAYKFLISCYDSFREAQQIDEESAEKGLMSSRVVQVFSNYVVDPPESCPIELAMVAPNRLHSKLEKAGLAIAKLA